MQFLVLMLIALAVVVASVSDKECRCPLLSPYLIAQPQPPCPPCPACHCICGPSQPAQGHFGHCEDGWTYYGRTGACYKVFHWKNFDDAEDFCRTKGGHLASIHSNEENKFVTEMAETSVQGDSHKKATWIGLKQAHWPQSKEWTWTDGTTVDFSPLWAPNQPDNLEGEHCTQLFSDIMFRKDFEYHKWNDCPCSDSMRAFVCKKRAFH